MMLLLLCLFSEQAFAIGFEQAKLHSHLGEPLNVVIPLLLGENDDLKQSNITLASPQEYKNLEQMLPESYPMLDVSVLIGDKKAPEVLVASTQAIDESFLVLILKVQRGHGNFYKKIQLFLDPVVHEPKEIKNKALWVNSVDTRVGYTPAGKDKKIPMRGGQQITPSTNLPSSEGWARRNRYGPVQYGDSLSEIAYRLRKDKRWSNHQIILALYDKNPDAFSQQDINQLKKGSFLDVPNDKQVDGFVRSPRYAALTPLLAPKTKKVETKKSIAPSQQIAQKSAPDKFHSKISLGLDESLNSPIADAIMFERLEKLEPLYKQAMATDLRIDGIGNKVDDLANEVRLLHGKVDALALKSAADVKSGMSSGWIWFVVLLVVNVLLFLAYLYRKQMRTWQNKMLKFQQQSHHKENYGDSDIMLDQDVLLDELFPDTSAEEELHDVVVPKRQVVLEDLDEQPIIAPIIEEESVKESASKEINYVTSFEEKVHKQDWETATQYYDLMNKEERQRPRVQALLVKKLHGEGDILGRNNSLLKLFKQYKDDEWHRFCSFFDEDVWYRLQEENIINYTGKVVEAEVERANLEAEDHLKDDGQILDLTNTVIADLSVDDFPIDHDERAPEIIPVSNADVEAADFFEKTVVMSAEDLLKWGSVEEEQEEETLDTVRFEIDLDDLDLDEDQDETNAEPEFTEINLDEPFSFELDLSDSEVETVTEDIMKETEQEEERPIHEESSEGATEKP